MPACELEVLGDGRDLDLNLFTREDGTGGLRMHYDAASHTCRVDRIGMEKRFNQSVGEVLDMPLGTPLRKLRIFIDRSSVEIFVNDGEETFTTHLYPVAGEFHYTASENAAVKGWEMKPSIRDDFVI